MHIQYTLKHKSYLKAKWLQQFSATKVTISQSLDGREFQAIGQGREQSSPPDAMQAYSIKNEIKKLKNEMVRILRNEVKDE